LLSSYETSSPALRYSSS